MFDAQCLHEISVVANKLKISSAALQAIAEVESGGRIFASFAGKREPLIRFEGHYFDRLLNGQQRQLARQQGLAHPKAGKIRNPRSQERRWELVNRAIKINRIAALSSVSWGLGQVMGAHWQWLGYGSVDALVAEARSGAAGQVRLMAQYIDRAGLIPTIQIEDWKEFARTYNGPSYARYAYDRKIEHALKRLSRQSPEPDVQNSQADRVQIVRMGEHGALARLAKFVAGAKKRMERSIRAGLLLISKRIL
ncbi:MAG: DUF3380 domain-containing protein [Rhizobiaceae bacterium]|nr:DUF3380 domain-containing protein [Rhizobiaceae bacterium]